MRNASPFVAWLLPALALLLLGACAGGDRDASTPEENEMTDNPLSIVSDAFDEGAPIPTKYTCDGEDISPALTWSDPPDSTRSWALIVDDPDAPSKTWVHWLVYNLPADTRELPAAMPHDQELPGGALQGKTDFGRTGYGGPCPPPGKPHRYFFKLYALDAALNLKPGASKSRIVEEMQGHILAEGRLMGTYGR